VKLLVVSQYFWPENFRINDVVLGLSDLGHEVTVLTGKPNYPSGHFASGYRFFGQTRERYGTVEIVRVPLIPRGGGGGLRLSINYASFALFATLLGPWLARAKYDAILAYEPSPVTVGLPALAMKAATGAPMLFWVQDLWPDSLPAGRASSSPPIKWLIEHLVRFIYGGSDRILIQSRAFEHSVARLGAPRTKIVYLPNSAEAFYKPLVLEADGPERAEVPDGFCVMYAGNIGTAQSFETVIEAAALLADEAGIHWVVLGEGRMKDWAVAEVARRNLQGRVHFLGPRPPNTMPRYFALADVLLVTLRRDPAFSQTIPSRVQSYLACARPIVAALDGEGARVVNEARAGLTCDPQDASGLAHTVLAMQRMSAAEREAMGRNGRKYFETEFERNMLLKRLERCLSDSAAERTSCAS
jgi:colanic acid biosynthesis glycosyl transferase WcaI